MNVSRIVSMNVIEMLTALIPLEVTTAAATLAMREMDSTAQVIHLFLSCEAYRVVLMYSLHAFILNS